MAQNTLHGTERTRGGTALDPTLLPMEEFRFQIDCRMVFAMRCMPPSQPQNVVRGVLARVNNSCSGSREASARVSRPTVRKLSRMSRAWLQDQSERSGRGLAKGFPSCLLAVPKQMMNALLPHFISAGDGMMSRPGSSRDHSSNGSVKS